LSCNVLHTSPFSALHIHRHPHRLGNRVNKKLNSCSCDSDRKLSKTVTVKAGATFYCNKSVWLNSLSALQFPVYVHAVPRAAAIANCTLRLRTNLNGVVRWQFAEVERWSDYSSAYETAVDRVAGANERTPCVASGEQHGLFTQITVERKDDDDDAPSIRRRHHLELAGAS